MLCASLGRMFFTFHFFIVAERECKQRTIYQVSFLVERSEYACNELAWSDLEKRLIKLAICLRVFALQVFSNQISIKGSYMSNNKTMKLFSQFKLNMF